MTYRFEFSVSQKREMAERSGGICEAGRAETHSFYGMSEGQTCKSKASEFDHIIADGLKRERPRSADDGNHVCTVHHKIKTHGHDRPRIQKAKDVREKQMGVVKRKRKIQSRGFGQYQSNTKQLDWGDQQ